LFKGDGEEQHVVLTNLQSQVNLFKGDGEEQVASGTSAALSAATDSAPGTRAR
jgi:hypothetical protein